MPQTRVNLVTPLYCILESQTVTFNVYKCQQNQNDYIIFENYGNFYLGAQELQQL